jgi:hypothetical protein
MKKIAQFCDLFISTINKSKEIFDEERSKRAAFDIEMPQN